MADNNLDALVYAYTTIPAPLVYPSRVAAVYEPRVELRVLKAGTKMSDPNLVPGEPSLKTDLDTWRSAGGSFAVNLSTASGLPAIVVPAGFTRVIYDRVPDASDPNGSRLDGPKPDQIPVAMEFLGRPFDEALLFEIASAYEAGTKHRRPPATFNSGDKSNKLRLSGLSMLSIAFRRSGVTSPPRPSETLEPFL